MLQPRIIVPFFCLLSSLFFLTVSAQDTLLQRLSKAKNDTVSIKALLNYGVDHINIDNDKARSIFELTLERSKALRYDYGMGASYSRLGYLEGQSGDQHTAIQYNLLALHHFEKIQRLKGIVMSYNNIGFNYDILGMADSSLFYYLKGVEQLEKSKSEPDKLARLYENISTLHANRDDIVKAIKYADKSVHYAFLSNDTDHIVTVYTGLSNVHLKGKHYKEGLDAALKAREYAEGRTDPVLHAKVQLNLAAAYVALNEPDSAIVAAKKSMDYSGSGDLNNYMAAGMDLADAYSLKKDFRREGEVLRLLQQKAEKDRNVYFLFDVYARLAKLSTRTGDYRNAYDFQVKHNLYKDSFFTQESRKHVAELETKYRTARNEQLIAEKQLQLTESKLALSKSNRKFLILTLAFIVVSLIAAGIAIHFRNKKRAFTARLLMLQQQKELDILHALMQGEEKERSRISKDLHDGVAGMLAASKMHLAQMVKIESAIEHAESYRVGIKLLDEAAQEVRKTSHNLMPEVLLQQGLDAALKRYCHNVGNSKTLTIQYDSWGELVRFNHHFELSVYRIVQELINNIVKHSRASQAIVQLSHQHLVLSITVEDNGVGFHQPFDQSGMGIKSLQSRIRAMNGKMEVESGPGSGVSAYLEFETSGLIIQQDDAISQ